jgi:putative ABC transport system permease protein
MVWREIFRLAYDSFCANKVRFALTSLGMVIGTASMILVVTIGLTGKHYVMNLIQGIGANMIVASYEGGGTGAQTTKSDYITLDDMKAAQQQVPGIIAASPMSELHERIPVGGGKEREVMVLGVSPDYQKVRNLWILAGRFLDDYDSMAHAKIAMLAEPLAKRLFGGQGAAIGRTIKLQNVPFTVVGTFKERVETFGQSEISNDTILIPYTVSRDFTGTDALKQIFFSVADAGMVGTATEQIHAVIASRHRPGSTYKVENLTELLRVAGKSANALTMVLLLVALVTLVVGGVGIMNIMFVTVRARTREIGIRKAIGATQREIRLQFLMESVLISLVGGVVGVLIGLTVPLSLRIFTDFRIPISGLSVIVALLSSAFVGIVFGTVPAARAAQADPVEALHYE